MARLIKKTPPPLTQKAPMPPRCTKLPPKANRNAARPQSRTCVAIFQVSLTMGLSRMNKHPTKALMKYCWWVRNPAHQWFKCPYELGLYISTGAGFLPSTVLSAPPESLRVRPLKRPWERKTPCFSFLGRQLFRGELVNFRGCNVDW